MRTLAAGVLQRGPRRSQPGNAARPDHRGELAAGLGTIALIAELLTVPLAVPVSLVLFAIGRVSRWRLQWLLVPLLAGVGWLAAAGPRWAVTTAAAGSGQLLSGLTHAAADPSALLRDPGGAAATALAWLPREVPGALVTGAVQAGLLTWLSLRRRGGSWRPGLIAAARRSRRRALLASGRTVTGTGCVIGLDPRTGGLAGLSWAEAEGGVLLTATDSGELSPVALAVVCAAMRRRKTVLVFDFDARRDKATLTAQVAMLASALGVPLSRASRPDGALRTAVGRAIRARSVLLASGPGALPTGEVTGLLAWLRERGLRGDSLLYLSGCEAVEPALLTELLALGPSTGTAILASTTSAACAEALAGHVGQTLVCGPVSQELSASLASTRVRAEGVLGLSGDALTRQLPGEFTVLGADYVRPGCEAVPITALDGPAGTGPPGARLAPQVRTAAGSG
jgi:hypothetical protein